MESSEEVKLTEVKLDDGDEDELGGDSPHQPPNPDLLFAEHTVLQIAETERFSVRNPNLHVENFKSVVSQVE